MRCETWVEFVHAWVLTAVSHTNNGSFLTNYLFSLELQVFNILEAITSLIWIDKSFYILLWEYRQKERRNTKCVSLIFMEARKESVVMRVLPHIQLPPLTLIKLVERE